MALMREHFHLLITEPQVGNPSVMMQALKVGFARRVLGELARSQSRKVRDLGHPAKYAKDWAPWPENCRSLASLGMTNSSDKVLFS